MPAKQTFPLVVGQTYKIIPPKKQFPGRIYLTGICRLLEVTADAKARFEGSGGNTFTIALSENRIFKY